MLTISKQSPQLPEAIGSLETRVRRAELFGYLAVDSPEHVHLYPTPSPAVHIGLRRRFVAEGLALFCEGRWGEPIH